MTRPAHDPFAPAAARRKQPRQAPAALTGVVTPPAVDEDPQTPVTASAEDPAAMLPDDLDDITKPDLIALAELAEVPTSGTKAEIAQRLRAARR